MKVNPKLARQRQWHGWAFRGYTDAQVNAIRHYIKTGEVLEDLPHRDKFMKTGKHTLA